MLRRKYPFEYELSPETLEPGTRWLTLRLKNIGNDSMHNLDINMHSTDSLQISLRKSSDHIFRLTPDEDRLLSFQVDAHGTTSLYFSVRYFKEGGSFHWDSPWIREQVHGEVAELERILVSNPYGIIGRELEAEATIKGLGSSDGLDLQFWADTPSGEHEELAEIKTKKLSRGEEVSYTAKITPKEKGYYTVYASLYDHNRRIGKNFDIMWVEK
ncbi:MAG TPA: hypothetical protein VEL11_01100 [Candidatus Bathyarchaeia archaeon]|nr:hypothetical protein [Candidatus Bathyarchaeia archaeon]